jgi:hypothetical protein
MIDISFGILYYGRDIISHSSRCGEIGRRSRLKICREQSLTGSSPVSGTMACRQVTPCTAPSKEGALPLCRILAAAWRPAQHSPQSDAANKPRRKRRGFLFGGGWGCFQLARIFSYISMYFLAELAQLKSQTMAWATAFFHSASLWYRSTARRREPSMSWAL